MGFHCHAELRFAYCSLSMTISVVMALLVAAIPKQHSEAICVVLIAGTAVLLLPALHWLWVVSSAGRRAAGGGLVSTIVLATTATFIFMRMIPECYAPGRFDLFLSSHQIWHVLIFLTIMSYGDVLTVVYALTDTAEYCAE